MQRGRAAPVTLRMSQLSFRIVVVLVVAFTLCARAEDDAAALKALGAKVEVKDGGITKVEFKDSSKLGEAELRRIGQIKTLKSLTVFGHCAGLDDQTLPLLNGLSNLEELSTEGVQLSDEGLKPLGSLTNLRSLAFFHLSLQLKGFTGKGFVALKDLSHLERLTVAGTSFDDQGMAAIGQLTQLKEFRTWHTYQTAAGNQELAKLTNLKSIRLGQRLRKWNGQPNPLSLDDSTLEVLAKIPSLETIYLDEARFSVPALSKLAGLPKLKTLTLEKVPLTGEQVESLKAALPKVAVTVKPIDAAEMTKLEAALKP